MAEAGLLFCYAETPVHAGGSGSAGVVDLPIQREGTTQLPTVWGQSAKGALRDHAREHRLAAPGRWPDVEAVFGSSPPGSPGAGLDPPAPGWLAVGDLRLVAFPVPTLHRTFAWVTSPLLLARLARSADIAGVAAPAVPGIGAEQVAPCAPRSWGTPGDAIAVGEHKLEIVDTPPSLTAWAGWLAGAALPAAPAYFPNKLTRDLLLVDDDDLATLTEEHAEVLPRVQLNPDAKTVAAGPWYTEYLPAETLLCSLLRDCGPDPAPSGPGRLDDLGGLLDGDLLVAGGDETLGKGLLWLRWHGSGGVARDGDADGEIG